jgi:ATP-dependent helicase IRC3
MSSSSAVKLADGHPVKELDQPELPLTPATVPSSPPSFSQLRPYQREAIDACMSALNRGVGRIGVSSPTGSGKTVMLWVLDALQMSM